MRHIIISPDGSLESHHIGPSRWVGLLRCPFASVCRSSRGRTNVTAVKQAALSSEHVSGASVNAIGTSNRMSAIDCSGHHPDQPSPSRIEKNDFPRTSSASGSGTAVSALLVYPRPSKR